MKLLDGKHRWLAFRKVYENDDPEITVNVYPVIDALDKLAIATRLNSDHGQQLSDADKESVAKSLYAYGMTYEEIAKNLSVGKAKVGAWMARTVKDQKEKRNKQIAAMWLACYTQDEIAEATGTPQQTVADEIKKFTETVFKNQTGKSAADHAADFDPPIYNIWKQQEKTQGAKHFGNSEVRWVDNLLYLYTRPLDIVVDPFAGSGSTIDICKKRYRRYYVSDRKPIVERSEEIRKHDLTEGLPQLPSWKDVALVYLDPPYWKQAEGQYSDDPTDLANMPIEEFNKQLAGVIKAFARKLTDAHIALIIQPTQWKAPDRGFVDHVGDMLRAVDLPVAMRYSVPYESQQCNAQMVEWAKANKQCLVLTREIVVWRVKK
jgi:transposase